MTTTETSSWRAELIKRNGGKASETWEVKATTAAQSYSRGVWHSYGWRDYDRICRITGRREARKEKLKGLPREKAEPLWLKYVAWFYTDSAAQFVPSSAWQTRERNFSFSALEFSELRARMTSGKPRGLAAVEADLSFDVRLFQEVSSFNLGNLGGKNCSKNKGKGEKRMSPYWEIVPLMRL